MSMSNYEIVTDQDGLESVVVYSQTENKPLARYFENDLTDLYMDGNLSRFNHYGDKQYKRVASIAGKYLARFKRIKGTGLYFYSDTPGSGKTMLSCLLAAAITRKHGATSQVINTISFFQEVQQVFSDESKTIEALMNPLKAVDLLVVDDLGAEKLSEYREDLMYEIVNYRLNHGKLMFFTSNYSFDKLPYHPRIVSRITEMSFLIAMPEEDMRAKFQRKNSDELFKALLTNN